MAIIDVRGAVSIASNFVQDLYKDKNISELLLEEVELSDDERFWYITIGLKILEGPKSQLPFLKPSSVELEKKYKVIKIDADTGKVINMKIRKI